MQEERSTRNYKQAYIIVSILLVMSLCALGLYWSKAREASEQDQAA